MVRKGGAKVTLSDVAARDLSYEPRNPGGSSLPVRAPSIGLVSDTVGAEPVAGELIRGCVTAATERGHALLMTETEGRRGLELSESRELVDRGVGRRRRRRGA